jgi:3-hydroxyisobutyrate dehydrogenase-like beta-hydroxyacid dehydrogenase
MKQVTVIGLGQMGSTLARLLLEAGYRVTVWNRTAAKAGPLVEKGAMLASSPLAAIQASSIIVACVHDHAAMRAILGDPGINGALTGKLLLQLTTGSTRDARESEAWMRERGGVYLDGAIQAAPSQMGRPDTPILLAGDEATYREHESLLRVFGGGLNYLGEDAGAAAAIDMATLSYIYGATLGFFHGARIAEAEGFPVDRYGELVAGIGPTFADFLKYEGEVIQSGDFSVGESPLSISVEATARIARAARESGINDEFPSFAASLFQRAEAAGHGDEEIAAMIKVLRSDAPAPAAVPA